VTANGPFAKAIFSASQISSCGEVDSAGIDLRPAFEKTPTEGREADCACQPQAIIWPGSAACEPFSTGWERPQECQCCRDLVISSQVSARQLEAESHTGGDEALEETAGIEVHRTAQSQKREGRVGTHSREIGEIDGEEPARHQSRIEVGREMHGLNLMILGYGPGSTSRENGTIIAKAVEPLAMESSSQPGV